MANGFILQPHFTMIIEHLNLFGFTMVSRLRHPCTLARCSTVLNRDLDPFHAEARRTVRAASTKA